MSWHASIERKPKIENDVTLRPYKRTRNIKIPTPTAMYFLGSTVAAAWKQIVIFLVYCITMFVVLYFTKWVSNEYF